MIHKYQLKYRKLSDKLKHAKYLTRYFCGGRNIKQLICKSDNTRVTTFLQKSVVSCQRTYLMHIGMDCTEATIGEHLDWTNLRNVILTYIKVRKTCEKNREQNKIYDNYLQSKMRPPPRKYYWYIL